MLVIVIMIMIMRMGMPMLMTVVVVMVVMVAGLTGGMVVATVMLGLGRLLGGQQ